MNRYRTRMICGLLVAVFSLATWGTAAALAQERDRPSDRAEARRDAANVPAALRHWIEGLPPEVRRSAVARLRNMPERRRRAFFRRFSRMSDAQRHELKAKFERQGERRRDDLRGDLARRDQRGVRDHYQRMTPAERRRFRAQANRWRDMKPTERDRMRRRLDHFSGLPPAEQEALVERSFPDSSPAERARKLRQLRSAATPERDSP